MRRLLIRPGAIGDCIVSLPALEHLKTEYLEVWVAAQNVPLIRFADRVEAISATGLEMVGVPEREAPRGTMERLAGFDSIVSWYGTNREEFREAVKGLPFRFLPALPAGMHAVDFYAAQVGLAPGASPRIEVPGSGAREYAAIHPFSGSAKKNWPLGNFRALARGLEEHMPVRWCAGPEEELEGAARFENLYDLACWLAGARIYLGNDSGITHLAAAVGTPVVAFFGPSDPEVWAPRGARVRIVRF